MSLGRLACRRALKSSSTSLADHVWISDELLASTFRRFIDGQRRYQSRVPGPLEARRRLARRRNTELAGVGSPGSLGELASLFGRNGKEHMKWSDGGAALGALGYQFPPPPNSAPSPVSFVDESHNRLLDVEKPLDEQHDETSAFAREVYIMDLLQAQTEIADWKDTIRRFGLNLRRDPHYSQAIFESLLSRAVTRGRGGLFFFDRMMQFLKDPALNVREARNYAWFFHFHSTRGSLFRDQLEAFDSFIRALELGLVSSGEILSIVDTMASFKREGWDKDQVNGTLTKFYRDMWSAICRCDVFGPKDLDDATVSTWLDCLRRRSSHDGLTLAKEIMVAVNHSAVINGSWAAKFISHWLRLPLDSPLQPDSEYVNELLKPFGADFVSETLIRVTEGLAYSRKNNIHIHALPRWRDCLAGLHHTPDIVLSDVWTDLSEQQTSADPPERLTSGSYLSRFSPQHQLVLRLWVLCCTLNRRFISTTSPNVIDPVGRQTARKLIKLYGSIMDDLQQDLFITLADDIRKLKIPYNGLLLMAYKLVTRRSTREGFRHVLTQLESSATIYDVFGDIHMNNAAHRKFFRTFERMVRQIDITGPDFLDSALQLIRSGDTNGVITVLRILRNHTPLKISLANAWYSRDRNLEYEVSALRDKHSPYPYPDPRDALRVIHRIAIAAACTNQLSSRRAFKVVCFIHAYLTRHSAPVRAPVARALYHSGVVRFREEGRRISPMQYQFIWGVVEKVEGPEVLEELTAGRVPYALSGVDNDFEANSPRREFPTWWLW